MLHDATEAYFNKKITFKQTIHTQIIYYYPTYRPKSCCANLNSSNWMKSQYYDCKPAAPGRNILKPAVHT